MKTQRREVATYTDPTTIIPTGTGKKIETGPLLAIIAATFAVLVVAFFFYQVYSTKSQTTKIQAEITAKQAEIATLQEVSTKVLNVQNQAKSLHSIFDNQVQWTSVLANLQAHLYRNMAITSLQLDQSGTAVMKGYTTDFTNYAKFYASLTDVNGSKYFTNVKPTSIEKVTKTSGGSEVDFIFTLKLTPALMPIQPQLASPTS